ESHQAVTAPGDAPQAVHPAVLEEECLHPLLDPDLVLVFVDEHEALGIQSLLRLVGDDVVAVGDERGWGRRRGLSWLSHRGRPLWCRLEFLLWRATHDDQRDHGKGGQGWGKPAVHSSPTARARKL